MGKTKYDWEYTCRERGSKYSRLQNMDIHYSESHERRRDNVFACIYCDYQSTRKDDVARHTTSRHPEKERPKDTETKEKKNEGAQKRMGQNSIRKVDPPKVRRMGSEWPSVDTLQGSPNEDLDKDKTTGAKSQSSKLPETPYVTPKKRQVASTQRRTQDPQSEEPRDTEDTPDTEETSDSGQTLQSKTTGTTGDLTPSDPNSGSKTNAVADHEDGRLVQLTTTTVNPDGSVKVVLEKFLES